MESLGRGDLSAGSQTKAVGVDGVGAAAAAAEVGGGAGERRIGKTLELSWLVLNALTAYRDQNAAEAALHRVLVSSKSRSVLSYLLYPPR